MRIIYIYVGKFVIAAALFSEMYSIYNISPYTFSRKGSFGSSSLQNVDKFRQLRRERAESSMYHLLFIGLKMADLLNCDCILLDGGGKKFFLGKLTNALIPFK